MSKQNNAKKITTTIPAIVAIVIGLVFGVKWLVVVGIALIVIPVILLGAMFVLAVLVKKVENK